MTSLGEQSIGDFAMGLIESGAIDGTLDANGDMSEASQAVAISHTQAPEAGVDISDVVVEDNYMRQILEGSFGIKTEPVKQKKVIVEKVNKETVPLTEEVAQIKSELAEHIKGLAEGLSRLLEMTTTMGIGVNMAGPQKDPMKKKKKKKK